MSVTRMTVDELVASLADAPGDPWAPTPAVPRLTDGRARLSSLGEQAACAYNRLAVRLRGRVPTPTDVYFSPQFCVLRWQLDAAIPDLWVQVARTTYGGRPVWEVYGRPGRGGPRIKPWPTFHLTPEP